MEIVDSDRFRREYCNVFSRFFFFYPIPELDTMRWHINGENLIAQVTSKIAFIGYFIGYFNNLLLEV